MSYDQARDQFQAVLDTWNRQEHMQIQENRQLLERASAMVSKKAEAFINNAIENTLRDCKLGNITGERQVRSNNSLSLYIYMFANVC